MLVNEKCSSEWHILQVKDEKGGFVCQTSSLRGWVTPDGSTGPAGMGGFAAEAGRYHLYEALICPLASRRLMARKDIDALNERLYSKLNNGVYRTGFVTTQVAYEKAFWGVFKMLDELGLRLTKGGPLLFGECLTASDIRLFVTLVRFDATYYALFKVNLLRIADYPALSAYMERVLNVPGLRETVNIDHIRRGYYSIKALNPTGIVPPGPDQPMFKRASPERRAA